MKDWDGEGNRSHSLAFFGWCVSTSGRAIKIEFYLHGTLLAYAPLVIPRPDVMRRHAKLGAPLESGFHLRLSKLVLPQAAQLEIRLWEERAQGEAARVSLGTITGLSAATVTSHYVERYQPLLVLGMGRSGTTRLMRLLAAHPEILVPGPHPYEMRQPVWLWHAAQVLSAPSSATSMHQDGFEAHQTEQLGYNPYRSRGWEKIAAADSAMRWQEDNLPLAAIDFCKRQVDEFVGRCAEGRPIWPRYVAQKLLISPVRYLVGNIYADAREVFLVRDFRDVWLSARSFNRKRGGAAFERNQFPDDLAWLRGLAFSSQQIRCAHAASGSRSQVVRYEDLMRDPSSTMSRVLGALGVDASPLRVREMLAEEIDDKQADAEEHRTSQSDGIERWRQEMTAEENAVAIEAFGEDLRYFGYEV